MFKFRYNSYNSINFDDKKLVQEFSKEIFSKNQFLDKQFYDLKVKIDNIKNIEYKKEK